MTHSKSLDASPDESGERVSQLARCGQRCFDSRRRVNSTVRLLRGGITLKRLLNLSLFALLLVITLTPASARTGSTPTYGILIDNSGSLRMQLPQIKSLAKELVSRFHQRGPISVYTFVRQGEVLVPASDAEWTQDIATLNNFIDRVVVTAGRTTLFDSIYSIAERIDIRVNANSAGISEKILILITDGQDRDSKISQQPLIEDLKKNGYKVYAIGMVQDLEDEAVYFDAKNPRRVVKKERPKKMAIQFLSEITTSTGGRVVFPKDKFKVDAVLDELLTP